MPGTSDRRPWLILSKREAEAMLPIIRDYLDSAPKLWEPDQDLLRAERVLTLQLEYIQSGSGAAPDVTATLIREQRNGR